MENRRQHMPGSAPHRILAPARQAVSAATAILLTAFLLSAAAQAAESGDFDYYALSLSWSPNYCATPQGRDDGEQCAPGRRFAFVVHGLWPQHQRGWPQDCDTQERWVPEERIGAMLDIMPSRKLIIHEWRKHGSCSGLSQEDYFGATRALFGKVRIPARYLAPQADILTTPAQLAADFVKSNRELTAAMISVQCGNARDRARLAELRICFDKAGSFIACGANEAAQCRARQLVMPPVR
jgi:ribonuclease T2